MSSILERFELAVPVSSNEQPVSSPAPDDSFPEPVTKVKATRPRDVTRERGILNYPTHHAANLSALCRLYHLPTVGA